MSVAMKETEAPCSELELEQLEQKMGKLPDGFARFLRLHNGGCPELNALEITEGIGTSITEFYGAARLLAEKEKLTDRLPTQWWPIAYTESGNLILLHANTGAIGFWDHEVEKIHPAAESFDRLLSDLQPFSMDDVETEPDPESWIDPDFLKSLPDDLKR